VTLALLWIVRVIIILIVLRLLVRLLFPALAGRRGPARPGRQERQGGELVRDPQCGTYVPRSRAVVVNGPGGPVYFCSTSCRDTYRRASA
jgi:hypothetical protein